MTCFVCQHESRIPFQLSRVTAPLEATPLAIVLCLGTCFSTVAGGVFNILRLESHLLQEFKSNTHHFKDFQHQFDQSALKAKIERTLEENVLLVTLDVVGLQHPPGNIAEAELQSEDDNIQESMVIRIIGRPLEGPWSTIGYLSPEHAHVARNLLRNSNNRYSVVELPNLEQTYETQIVLRFNIIDGGFVDRLADNIINTCGDVKRERIKIVA